MDLNGDHRALSGRNYYLDLGVSFLADDDEVRQAFRALALKYHPDRRPADAEAAAERFRRAADAYEVLADPSRRRSYDLLCTLWLSGEEYLDAFGALVLTISGLGLKAHPAEPPRAHDPAAARQQPPGRAVRAGLLLQAA